jgi:hypothetical protein
MVGLLLAVGMAALLAHTICRLCARLATNFGRSIRTYTHPTNRLCRFAQPALSGRDVGTVASKGLISYEAVLGQKVTLPAVLAKAVAHQ